MSIQVTLTNKRHVKAAEAAFLAANASHAALHPGQVLYPNMASYVQSTIERVAESWAETTGVDRIAVGAFVRRFPGAVMDAVKASADPNVAAILAQLDAVTTVRLGHATTTQGVGYLVAAGLMTQAQADVVLAY